MTDLLLDDPPRPQFITPVNQADRGLNAGLRGLVAGQPFGAGWTVLLTV